MWQRWGVHVRHSKTSAEESSYLASAADLMAGVLFVFIILVAYLALQKQLEEAQRGAERDPRGEVTKLIGRQLTKTMPNIVVDAEKGLITLPDDALFASGSSRLRGSAKEKLETMSESLQETLKCFVANRRAVGCGWVPRSQEIDTIFIEGHTDAVPLLRPGGNLQLSLERAVSVHEALVKSSDLENYKNRHGQPVFAFSAYGDQRLLNKFNPASAKNRRVVLRVVLSYQPPKSTDRRSKR